MRILWTLFKLIVGLAIAIPLGIVVLVFTLGILGGVLGLAVLALKLGIAALIVYALLRLGKHLITPAPSPAQPARDLPKPDPYYEAALRDLDAHMRRTPER